MQSKKQESVQRRRETLHTARLTLEPIQPDHADELFQPLQEPQLYTFIPQDPPSSIEALRERFARLATGRSPDGTQIWLNWAARRRDTEIVVGLYQATVYPESTADIAYITFAGHQGEGFAREACAEILRHLGDRYGLEVAARTSTRATKRPSRWSSGLGSGLYARRKTPISSRVHRAMRFGMSSH